MTKIESPFPFLFGGATSSHQVEGANRGNDWWDWEIAGKVPYPSGSACGHYERFREDLDLAAALGHNAYRFSVEWSRIQPEENRWNEEALLHYRDMAVEARRRGLEPIVTLHHFTNPLWLVEKGGWLSDECVADFERFVLRTVEFLGPHVRFWITINEPMVYIYKGFFEGAWPPGIQSASASIRVLRNMLRGHVQAYWVLHRFYEQNQLGMVWVSLAKHVIQFDPCRSFSKKDQVVTALRSWFFNDMVLEALTTGYFFLPGCAAEFLPLRDSLDFIGINYYFRDFIRFDRVTSKDPLGEICDKKHHPGQIHGMTQMGWEVRPEGLYERLIALKRFCKPVMITENGVATLDEKQRESYIINHLSYTALARKEGVAVWGYLYWSLLDNFEWDKGFGPKFGLVGLGSEGQRQVKSSAHVLTDTCRKLFCKS